MPVSYKLFILAKIRSVDPFLYLDLAPADRGENVRREICFTLQEMSIRPESSHHENGPGQNEIDFRASDPLTSADNVTTFKNVVQTVAQKNGLHARFDPKPLADSDGSRLPRVSFFT